MKKLLLMIFIMTFCYLYSHNSKTDESIDLSVANIECLAQNEGSGNSLCFGSGSIDCNGIKVKYIVSGLR